MDVVGLQWMSWFIEREQSFTITHKRTHSYSNLLISEVHSIVAADNNHLAGCVLM